MPPNFFQKKWVQRLGLILLTAAIIYGMIYADVWARAKSAYEEGEKASQKNDWKMAYTWYQTALELFSPPESKWVKRSRLLAPAAKQKWREDLRKRKVPFEEYNLDLEAGEPEGSHTVFTTQNKKEAERLKQILEVRKISVIVYDEKANKGFKALGVKLIVPEKQFWPAHEIIRRETKYGI